MSEIELLHGKALGVRESAHATRARLIAQQEAAARLAAELRALRNALGSPVRGKAAPPAQRPAPAIPREKEAAMDSARAAATSFPRGTLRPSPLDSVPSVRVPAAHYLPYAAIAAAAMAMHLVYERARPVPAAEPVPVAAAPAMLDAGAEEALLLAHEWQVPGDALPLIDRLGLGLTPPGSKPAWTAERVGERVYRVSFRPGAREEPFEFDVDLDSRRVDPLRSTAERIAPRLAAR